VREPAQSGLQGWKKLDLCGAEATEAELSTNSKNAQIQDLGDQLIGVTQTFAEGARLETLLQHDPHGSDKETEFLMEAAKDGLAQQVGAIKEILGGLEGDSGCWSGCGEGGDFAGERGEYKSASVRDFNATIWWVGCRY